MGMAGSYPDGIDDGFIGRLEDIEAIVNEPMSR